MFFCSCIGTSNKKGAEDKDKDKDKIETLSGQKIKLREGEKYTVAKYIGYEVGMINMLKFKTKSGAIIEISSDIGDGNYVKIGARTIPLHEGKNYELIYAWSVDGEAGTNNETEDLSCNVMVDFVAAGGKFQSHQRYQNDEPSEPTPTYQKYNIPDKMIGDFRDPNTDEILVFYTSSANSNKVDINYQNTKGKLYAMQIVNETAAGISAKFVNESRLYRLYIENSNWICINPDGTKQVYYKYDFVGD